MSQITCLRCKEPIDAELEQCPHCNERVTLFQRTYASKLIDGKYQILDRLGIGGMGEIFKVRHIHLNELRVIKIMRPNVAQDDQGLSRFLQEARTSTMIKHKNLAMLYDFAQLDDGSYYMVWEFIDGTNIQKWMSQNGPMPPRLTVEIAIQALMGLDHLHSMGLIHRDVSPENIMLSQDHHSKLLVKVIDFGIAKALAAEGESGQGLTQTGMFLGKLKYASPEQAGFLKEGEHLDARSDLYSFGIVMYEMLAGRAPFQATNPHGYILKHVTEKPAAIGELNPNVKVPPQLEQLIFRSLEKNRDARFAGAAEFAAALEGIRTSIPPDAKYGLGEKMITLSGAQTLADLPKVSGSWTTPGVTSSSTTRPAVKPQPLSPPGGERVAEGRVRGGPTGTKVADEQATLVERNFTAPGAPVRTLGSDEATMVENFGRTVPGGATPGGAAPTALEPKYQPGAAETVIERQYTPPAKKKTALIGAVAAAVIIALLGIGYFATRKPQPPAVVTQTMPASGTVVSATAPTSTAPIASGQGVLLLSASPWGEVDRILDASQKPIDLSDEKRSTPTRIELAPGKYLVTMSGPAGKTTTFDVQIDAGRPTQKKIELGVVDYDALEKEVSKP
ncbi:MAG TPA: protein kinase [Thermoanaerobaculia bacterium]|nr:protein kinase [Thermoanaerobaculia bacterium]